MGIGRHFSSHRFDAGDDPFTWFALDKLEGHRRTRFESAQQRRRRDLELHGHARPFETGDRPVIERQHTCLGVEPLDRAFGLMPDSSRLG